MNKLRCVCAALVLATSTGQGAYREEEKPVIEVKVEVTEIDHVSASRLGVEWVDQISVSEKAPAGIVALGSITRVSEVRADLHFLVENGAAELLANPNLVTDSGTTATFHAGGEIPYITSTALGSTHVEFKPYGIELKIQPTLTGNGRIRMNVEAGVSAPDQTNGVVLSGNAVPALRERVVTSRVTMDPGETMTLAGLVQSTNEKTTRGVPFLRRIPILGLLFRWERTQHKRSTIVMFVTPRLVEN